MLAYSHVLVEDPKLLPFAMSLPLKNEAGGNG